MGATNFEYRFRFAIHAVVFFLAFSAPWLYATTVFGTRDTVWNLGMSELARTRALSFNSAAILLLLLAIAFTALAAWLRTWGSAYVGAKVVHSNRMHGDLMLADGPYRRTRNPLYLGTLLHTFGIALVMPVSGAIFAVVLMWVFQVRLALAEEPFLAAQFGDAYRDYAARVPRFMPSLTPRVPAAGARPHWPQAALGEFYFLCVPVVFAIFGWSFNSDTLLRGILIAVGVSFIVHALMPRPKLVTT